MAMESKKNKLFQLFSFLKKEKLNNPMWIWITLSVGVFLFYSIYLFHDIIWTTKNVFTRIGCEYCLNYANYDFIYKDDVKCMIKEL